MDRASMSVNLEVRSPLLDHGVVEWSWRLPRSLKLRTGVGKWALRQVVYRRVPPRLIDRPKMGFTVPIDAWLRGPLRGWADELLLDERRVGGVDDLLDGPAVARTWKAFRDGRESGALGLWAIAVFQAWRARWAA